MTYFEKLSFYSRSNLYIKTNKQTIMSHNLKPQNYGIYL